MIPVLGIPQYNRIDLLERCVSSIDYPVAKLVIVWNHSEFTDDETPRAFREFLRGHPFIRETEFIEHPNAGVAGAWNEIIKLFPSPYWMLVNNDIQFAPGDLERMNEAAKHPPFPVAAYYANHGASFWIVTYDGIDKVGLFDENFYPAYLEDCDWCYRAELIQARRVNVQGCSSIHGDENQTGSCTVNHTPELAQKNVRTHGHNFEYYRTKWGGVNGAEIFKTPYDKPYMPVWAWYFSPFFRRKQQW